MNASIRSHSAAPAITPPLAAAPGVSPGANAALSEVAVFFHQVERALRRGAATEGAQEQARRDLGRLIDAAADLRSHLPDPYGLRAGTGAQRAARAVFVHMQEHGALPGVSAVAALMETTPTEARVFLLRAGLKQWVRGVALGFPDRERWTVTMAGAVFCGGDEVPAVRDAN